MKALLIGSKGSIGKRRMSILQDLNVDVMGVDKETEVLPSLIRKFDCIFICSPNDVHMQHVLYAIQENKPFFCEKPLAPTARDGHYIGSHLVNSELVNMVACNIRFTDEYQYIKKAVSNIGRPLYTFAEFGYYLPYWRQNDYRTYYSCYKMSGGGVLLDCVHEIDYLFDLFGPVNFKKTPLMYKIQNTGELNIETEDDASLFWVSEYGQPVFLHLDYLQRTYKRKFVCVGTKGRVDCTFNVQDNSHMYREEMRHFLECVKSGKETVNPVYKHLKVLDFVDTVKKGHEDRNSDSSKS